MKLLTLHLPLSYIEKMDELIAEGYYPNRAELIRIALRDLFKYHKKFHRRKSELTERERRDF